MPEVTLTSPVAVRLKTRKGKDYTLIKQDGEDKGYFAWDKEQGDLAKQAEDNGQAIVVVYDDSNPSYPEVTEVRGPVSNGDAPPARTTVHQSAGGDVLARAVNNALAAAVAARAHVLGKDLTPRQVAAEVEPLASSFVKWAKFQLGLKTDEDTPF